MTADRAQSAVSASPAPSVVGERGELAQAFVSLPVAARFLGLARSTAYLLAERGDFPVPVVRMGRSPRVAVAALERFAADAA